MCDHSLEAIRFSEDKPPVCTKCGFDLTTPEIEERLQSIYAEQEELRSKIIADLKKLAKSKRESDVYAGRRCTTCGGPILYTPGTVPIRRGRPRKTCDDCKKRKTKDRVAKYWANNPDKRKPRRKRKTIAPSSQELGGAQSKKERDLLDRLATVVTR